MTSKKGTQAGKAGPITSVVITKTVPTKLNCIPKLFKS